MSVLDQLYAAPEALSHTLLAGVAVIIAAIIGIVIGIRSKRP